MSPSIVRGPNFFIALTPGCVVCVSRYSSWREKIKPLSPSSDIALAKTNSKVFGGIERERNTPPPPPPVLPLDTQGVALCPLPFPFHTNEPAAVLPGHGGEGERWTTRMST